MAKSTIGNLSVILKANTAQFNSAMRAAVSPVKSLTSGITGLMRSAMSLPSLLTGGLLGGGMAYFVRQSMSSIDSLAKMSRGLGIASERLAGLHHAMELSGGSAEDMNKGLRQMMRILVQASEGAKGPTDALAMLNLSYAELIKLSPDLSLMKIADALINVENPMERVALAMEIFGKGGATMMPLLMAGSKEIKSMAADAAKLGLAINNVDANMIEQANDAISRMGKSLTGVFHALSIKLAPMIKYVSDRLTDMITSINWRKWFREAIEWSRVAFSHILDDVQILVHSIAEMLEGLGAAMQGSIARWLGLGDAGDALLSMATQLNKRVHPAFGRWGEQFYKSTESATKRMEHMAMQTAMSIGQVYDEELASEAQRRHQEQMQAMQKLQDEADRLTQSLRTPSEIYSEELARLDSFYDQGLIKYETYIRGHKKLEADLIRAIGKRKEVMDTFDPFRPVSALSRGSGGDISFRAGRYAMANTKVETQIEVAKQDLEESKIQTDLLNEIINRLQGMQIFSLN